MQSAENVMYNKKSKSLGIKSYGVTCSSRYNLIVLCWVRMHEWKVACKSKFRAPSLINTKQNMDVFKILCINMIVLACGKGNAGNKSKVLGTFKLFD